MNLYPFQIPILKALAHAHSRRRGVALLAPTGIGKTYVAGQYLRDSGETVGVVCPKAVVPVWEAMLPAALWVRSYEKAIRNPASLAKPEHVVVDEAQRCKGWKTKQGRLLSMFWENGCRITLTTATLAESPLDMRHTGLVLGLHKGGDHYWKWLDANFCVKDTRFGGMKFVGGDRIMHRIRQEMGEAVVLVTKVPDLPETTIQAVEVPVQNVKSFERHLAEAHKKYGGTTLHSEVAGEREVAQTQAMLRARIEVEKAKVPAMIDIARDSLSEGNSVVAFLNFLEPLHEFASALKCGIYCGSTRAKDRETLRKGFQDDRLTALAVQSQAGGVGLSLHGKRRRHVLASPPWSARDLKQLLGRVPRIDGSPSLQQVVFASGTVERMVMARVRAKLSNLESLNDSDFRL